MTTGNPAPLAYSLSRDTASDIGNGHDCDTWIVHVQGLPLGHELDGSHELPRDIHTGGEAHLYVQARLPGARYMSPDQKRGRKYRGDYPSKIRELFAAGSLWVATCNNGARYSIPAGSGLAVPALGECVLAFERTDWTGETYGPDTDTTGTCLPSREREALEADYLANRVDLPSPCDAAARVQGKAFVTRARYNVWNVRDASGACIATRATLYGPDGAQVMAETINRRVADTNAAETERLERLEGNRAARVRRDNVEYHAGAAARAKGEALEACPAADTAAEALEPAQAEPAAQATAELVRTTRRDNVEYHAGRDAWAANRTKDSNPYTTGGERAARWDLGWQESCDNGDPVAPRVARLDALEAIATHALALLANMESPRTAKASEPWDALRAALGRLDALGSL